MFFREKAACLKTIGRLGWVARCLQLQIGQLGVYNVTWAGPLSLRVLPYALFMRNILQILSVFRGYFLGLFLGSPGLLFDAIGPTSYQNMMH